MCQVLLTISENPMQVLIRKITSQGELEAIIRYLNPCSAKKEHRIPFYPKNCQCMRGYGDYAMPITATCTYGTAKKMPRGPGEPRGRSL